MANFTAVNKLLDAYVDNGRFAGYSVLVSRNAREMCFRQYGMADVERQNEVQRDTIFRIYSMTKPITSVAMMQLSEQGKFSIDDPVQKWIPAWDSFNTIKAGSGDQISTVPALRPMQIRDLLTHTSGLTYGFDQSHPVDRLYHENGIHVGSRNGTLDEFADKLAGLPLCFSPGTQWNYSVATDVVGYLVQQISGKSLDVYIKENITDPLGMADTAFSVAPADASRLAACYVHVPETSGYTLQDDPVDSAYLKKPALLSGGGGMVGTIDDYHVFCLAMLGKGQYGDTRILKPETVDLMTSNQLPDGQDLGDMGQSVFSETTMDGVGFGLGYAVVLDPKKAGVLASPGEFSWGGMASTYHFIDPATGTIVVFMTQLIPSSSWPVRTELKNAVYAAFSS